MHRVCNTFWKLNVADFVQAYQSQSKTFETNGMVCPNETLVITGFQAAIPPSHTALLQLIQYENCILRSNSLCSEQN